MGKPKGSYSIKFDLAQVEALRGMMATDEEMAAVLKCSVPTIERRKVKDSNFREAYLNGTAKGRVTIRRALFKLMVEGNLGAAIWLSKQYLGMRDVMRAEVTGANGGAVEMAIAESAGDRIASRLAMLATRLTEAGLDGSKPN